ncbi:hypothetical protein [Siminovitchia fordii]|uniref:DNA primase n=1 Tax=Siminovitchia fordii TaxID=254759 RepID=A0ABQ4K9Y7_9BACI|nr:hypothetical protein [Siminovitchia fordii]GIN22539.1 hypothetical protein J1TS3_36730 [Siminovitchia fordii]
MRLDKERIKDSLEIEDIHKILTDLGSTEPKYDRNKNPIYTTVCHSGDSHKLYYFKDSKQFHCFTGCSATFDIYDLVLRAKQERGQTLSFPQSVSYVANVTGKSYSLRHFSDTSNEKITDWQWINKLKQKNKVEIDLPTYDEKVLDVFMPYAHEDWINEGISHDTIERFNIGYYFREERITIPHYSIDGHLVGIRGRSMLQEDIDNGRKYMPISVGGVSYSHPTMANLYGIHKTKDTIKRLKKCAIFEGEKSVLKIEDYYKENNFSVACCSSSITNFQRDLLLSLGIEEVIICFDKFRKKKETETKEKYEEEIKNYQERLINHAKKFTPYVRTYVVWCDDDTLDYKDSPADKGKRVLEKLMKNKIEIKTSGVLQ